MGSPEDWPALRDVYFAFYVTEDGLDKALRELSMTELMESKRVQFRSFISVDEWEVVT